MIAINKNNIFTMNTEGCIFFGIHCIILNKIKILLLICTVFMFLACDSSGKIENTKALRHNLLNDIETFTPDSLVNAVIEIPAGSNQKWEVNKETGKIEWEQLTADSFRVVDYLPYPANYGFVPQTLLSGESGGDGDPIDVFVLGSSIAREEIVKARIVGIIHMTDDNESDSKLIAVNINEPRFEVNSLENLTNNYPGVIDILKIWLSNYKGTGRVKIESVQDEKDAMLYLKTAHINYINRKN